MLVAVRTVNRRRKFNKRRATDRTLERDTKQGHCRLRCFQNLLKASVSLCYIVSSSHYTWRFDQTTCSDVVQLAAASQQNQYPWCRVQRTGKLGAGTASCAENSSSRDVVTIYTKCCDPALIKKKVDCCQLISSTRRYPSRRCEVPGWYRGVGKWPDEKVHVRWIVGECGCWWRGG